MLIIKLNHLNLIKTVKIILWSMLSFDVFFLIQDNRLYGLGLDFIQVTSDNKINNY